MLTVAIETTALEELGKRTVRELQLGMQRAVEHGADEAIRYARNRHAHKTHTGTLTSTRHLKWRPVYRTERVFTIELVNDAPYATYVEEGTRPHMIWPKEGHGVVGPLRPGQSRRAISDIGTHRVALRIPVEGGGYVFRRSVRHPGSKPYPFMYPAAQHMADVVAVDLNVRIGEIAKLWG